MLNRKFKVTVHDTLTAKYGLTFKDHIIDGKECGEIKASKNGVLLAKFYLNVVPIDLLQDKVCNYIVENGNIALTIDTVNIRAGHKLKEDIEKKIGEIFLKSLESDTKDICYPSLTEEDNDEDEDEDIFNSDTFIFRTAYINAFENILKYNKTIGENHYEYLLYDKNKNLLSTYDIKVIDQDSFDSTAKYDHYVKIKDKVMTVNRKNGFKLNKLDNNLMVKLLNLGFEFSFKTKNLKYSERIKIETPMLYTTKDLCMKGFDINKFINNELREGDNTLSYEGLYMFEGKLQIGFSVNHNLLDILYVEIDTVDNKDKYTNRVTDDKSDKGIHDRFFCYKGYIMYIVNNGTHILKAELDQMLVKAFRESIVIGEVNESKADFIKLVRGIRDNYTKLNIKADINTIAEHALEVTAWSVEVQKLKVCIVSIIKTVDELEEIGLAELIK